MRCSRTTPATIPGGFSDHNQRANLSFFQALYFQEEANRDAGHFAPDAVQPALGG